MLPTRLDLGPEVKHAIHAPGERKPLPKLDKSSRKYRFGRMAPKLYASSPIEGLGLTVPEAQKLYYLYPHEGASGQRHKTKADAQGVR